MALLIAWVASANAYAQGLVLELEAVATGLARPLVVTHAGDGSGRLFIAEQGGRIRILDAGSVEPTPFLDVGGLLETTGNEQGLLGLAFDPDYVTNGFFYVSYTEPELNPPVDCPTEPQPATCDANSIIARYQVSGTDPNVADPASAKILLRVNQPRRNHNGGNLAFGPDGYLYAGFGDGGGGGDPYLLAQDLGTLHGSIIRIDPDASPPPEPNGLCGEDASYGVPASNPFVGQAGACDEIWSYGLRNPWRWSFDRSAGDLFIGDVGQGTIEEIDFQAKSSSGGENYGWSCYEGSTPYPGGPTCSGPLEFPILEYPHSNPPDPENSGRSVTGGFRYRGALHPELDGVYIYADFAVGRVWGTVPRCDAVWESQLLLDNAFLISTLGEDESGELYLTEFRTGDPTPPTSKVHRLLPTATSGGPLLQIAPSALDFGANVQAGTSASRELVVTNGNTGPEALLVKQMTLSDTVRFQIDPGGGSSPCGSISPCLSPGASCTVSIVFSPTQAGPTSESLSLTANSEPQSAAFTATAVECAEGGTRLLAPATVTDTRTEEACWTLAADSYQISGGASVQLRAGHSVELRNGFEVALGGSLVVAIDSGLLPP